MAYTDAFLVEKLREILLRLYPTPIAKPITSHIAPRNSPKLSPGESAFVNNETQEVDYNNGGYYSSASAAGVYSEGSNSFVNDSDIGIIRNFSSAFSAIDREFSDDLYIVGNYTLQSSKSENVASFSTSARDDHDTTALTRNLQEFIQVLKMSLNSGGGGTSLPDSMNGGGIMMGSDEHGDTLSGVTISNSPDMDFNFTLDDITDLNNLLDGGSESSLQFKHFLIIVSYFLIACISIVGNLLVVQLVIRSRRLHTLTHALLANLAVADLLMATLNIPFSAARVILAEWPFGSVLCHVVPFVQVTSVYVTSITMAVIAIDRYSVIMNPLGRRMKSSQGVFLVLGIWILSASLSMPYAIHHKVETVLTVRVVKRCQADFGSLESRRWLTVATFLAQYLIPLLFTTVSYVSIMQRLRQRSSVLGSTTPRQVAAQSRAKKKTIKMLVLTVVFFAVSWAPINIYHLLTHFLIVRHNSTAILICHMIAMTSLSVNPFIYCWFNEHFRREALKWVRCFRTRRCPIVHPAVEINGMLTRADLCHRAQSTTLVHTASIRRSPQLSQSQQLRGTNNPGAEQFLTLGGPCTRMTCSYNSISLNAKPGDIDHASPVGYRPETLFLAKRTSLDDIFVDHLGYGGEEEELEETTINTEPEPRSSNLEEDEENCEDYFEKPRLFNRKDGVSISNDYDSCGMGTLDGICGSSEDSGDQV